MLLQKLIITISDHGDALVSKAIHHIGVIVGIGGGAATYATGKAVQASQMSPITSFVLEWGGLISMVAAGTLILKNIADVILASMKAHWDRQEQLRRMDD